MFRKFKLFLIVGLILAICWIAPTTAIRYWNERGSQNPFKAWADTFTSRLGLTQPAIGSSNWGTNMNNNLATIDSLASQVVTKTGNYTLTSSDTGTFFIFNCSSACTATLYATPSSTYRTWIMSVGTSLASISLNGLNFNGASAVPVLTSYRPLHLWSDGSNYFGEAPFAAGTNVTFTSASNNTTVSATGGGGTDPLDATQINLVDEFLSQGITSVTVIGSAGGLNWSPVQTGGSNETLAYVQGTYPHLGIERLGTAAANSQGGCLKLGSGTSLEPFGNISANSGWTAQFIFRLNQVFNATTLTNMRVGFTGTSCVALPGDEVELRFDNVNASDTTFQAECRKANTFTTTDTTVTPAAQKWYKLTITNDGTNYTFTLVDSDAQTTLATKTVATSACPTVGMTPSFVIQDGTDATAKQIDIDRFAFKWTGITAR